LIPILESHYPIFDFERVASLHFYCDDNIDRLMSYCSYELSVYM